MRHTGVRSIEHENRLYDRLRELSRQLKIPLIEPLLRVSKIDRDGKRELVIDRHCRSYTRNMYNVYFYQLNLKELGSTYADGSNRCKHRNGSSLDVGNFAYKNNVEAGNFGYISGPGVLGHGIVIGTGTTAESFDDYVIETVIAHGVGGGQMEYADMVAAQNEGWVGGGPYYFHEMERVMSNNSGGSITVNESVLYWCGLNSNYVFCVLRDKFGAGVAVADGESIAVNYELRQTYP